MDAGAIGLAVGEELAIRAIPKGISWIHTQIKGETILIMGDKNSGKTCLYEYLVSGSLSENCGTNSTTGDTISSRSFTIKINDSEVMNICVKKVLDPPGELGPVEHARIIGYYKPTVIFVLINSSIAVNKVQSWTTSFINEIQDLSRDSIKIFEKIHTIIFLLNKKDKSDDGKRKKISDWLRKELNKLNDIIDHKSIENIPIMNTVLIENVDGTKSIDRVLRKLALRRNAL